MIAKQLGETPSHTACADIVSEVFFPLKEPVRVCSMYILAEALWCLRRKSLVLGLPRPSVGRHRPALKCHRKSASAVSSELTSPRTKRKAQVLCTPMDL